MDDLLIWQLFNDYVILICFILFIIAVILYKFTNIKKDKISVKNSYWTKVTAVIIGCLSISLFIAYNRYDEHMPKSKIEYTNPDLEDKLNRIDNLEVPSQVEEEIIEPSIDYSEQNEKENREAVEAFKNL